MEDKTTPELDSSEPLATRAVPEEERSDDAAPVVSDLPDGEEHNSVLPFPIVGIGASAGGLEAFTDLLHTTPVDTGMSFVIISHLPPQHRSLLPEILSRNTRMPVHEVSDGMRPEPNTVYVIPSNTRLVLSGGNLHLEARPQPDRIPRPIDIFFRSLAEEQKNRAIGIVLSGTDSDGALGLRAIKGDGGIAIVQDERTARFEEMPRNAIAADHVDLVLPPGDIGTELGRIAYELKHFGQRLSAVVDASSEDQRALKRIYSMLRDLSGIDFTRYKQSTLRRRIARRMVLKKTESIADYARLLQVQTGEARELYEDALIGVTRFFRDPEVFEALKNEIFPRLFQNRSPSTPIRIWVPGCATGEEVYSIAMCLLEYLGSLPVQTPIHIFGTDVSERSIDRARLAIYPDTIAAEISSDRIRHFFTKLAKGYQVGKRLRELCVFAKHNLTQDPPYSRLDLVSCRNVLIYLGAPAQKNTISGFHYALKPSGVLLLGQSETIREFPNLFTLIDKKNKFYVSNPATSRIHVELFSNSAYSDLSESARQAREIASDSLTDLDLMRAADRIVVARHGPPGVVVTDQMEVVQTRGDTSAYLMLPQGPTTLNLLRMAKEGLGPVLRDGLQRAIKDDLPVFLENVRVQTGPASTTVTVEILPVPNLPAKGSHFLVLFLSPVTRTGEELIPLSNPVPATPDEKDRESAKVRQDLTSTRLYLQSLIEERDAKNQELISANEEVQSSNEELQSINEELETAKEELQSSNEELQTVNEELQRKNEQFSQTTSDLTNLLNNITMPVPILGSDLHIRQFTPLAERVLSMRQADLGRHIREIRLNLRIEDLEPLLLEVIDTLATKEIEVEDRQGRWYLLRARPYRTVDHKIDGVVLVLIDIDQIRNARQELKQARDFSQTVIESVQVSLAVLDSNLIVQLANKAFLTTSGLSPGQVINRDFPELARTVWDMEDIQPMLANIREQESESGGFAFEHTYDEGRRTLLVHAQSIRPEGRPGVLIALEDITSRKQAQQLLRHEQRRLEGRVQMTEDALRRSNDELQRLTANLLVAQEEERRRVARDLHDDLTQKVAVLEMHVEQLEQAFPPGGAARQGLADIRRQAAELTEGLRRVAHQLHPQILDDLGLPVALERLIEEFRTRDHMRVRFVTRSLPPDIPRSQGSCLYRIAQEALHNVAKHAGDTPVNVTLAGVGALLQLSVHDDGRGFDIAQARLGEGLGLVSMQERVRLLGGVLSINSKPGGGTSVEASIPIPVEGES